jgi:tryptophan-rich sensory protein
MYAGAALSAVSLILTVAVGGRIKSAVGTAIRRAETRTGRTLTAAQIHTDENVYFAVVVVVLAIAVGLWIWMAWANGRGKGWARVVSSVFFGLDTLLLILGFSRASAALIYTGLIWLVGLAALILLWRRETTQYIAQSR